MQCYGVGPATDVEDGPKGFGAHSDQERILEAELHRFVQFFWDATTALQETKRLVGCRIAEGLRKDRTACRK